MSISQFEQREHLSSKCLDLAGIAFEQQDVQSAIPLLRKALQLTAINFAAMRLEHGGTFDQSFVSSPLILEFVDLVCTMGGEQILYEAGLADLVEQIKAKGGDL